MDEDDLICSAYNSMLEDGFDETDYEAAEYAAEVLQAEAEAYFLRSKAGQSGHHGFGGGAARQFQVQGHLSMEERKARVQQLTSKTHCRRCGQTGHWANDPQCPKSFRKGKGKGSSPTSSGSTSTSASPKSGKGSKSGKSDKSCTVYFTINEYEAENDIDPEVHMVMKEEMADEALDRLIADARLRQLRQQQPQPIQDAPVPEWSDYVPVPDYSILHSLERKAHLDTFMAVVND